MRTISDLHPGIPTQRGARTPDHAPDQAPDHDAVRELRGVLHDVGHGLATLSLLVDGLADATHRGAPVPDLLDMVGRETARLLAVVHTATAPVAVAEVVPVRTVLEPIASAARRTGPAPVRLVPGPDVHLRIDPVLLSRVVANLVDNAARAAGPTGRVDVVVTGDRDVVIDVVDNGPGYPRGPAGTSNLGLDVVTRLLAACGGRLEIDHVAAGGTRMRVVLPGRVGRHRAGPASRCA